MTSQKKPSHGSPGSMTHFGAKLAPRVHFAHLLPPRKPVIGVAGSAHQWRHLAVNRSRRRLLMTIRTVKRCVSDTDKGLLSGDLRLSGEDLRRQSCEKLITRSRTSSLQAGNDWDLGKMIYVGVENLWKMAKFDKICEMRINPFSVSVSAIDVSSKKWGIRSPKFLLVSSSECASWFVFKMF